MLTAYKEITLSAATLQFKQGKKKYLHLCFYIYTDASPPFLFPLFTLIGLGECSSELFGSEILWHKKRKHK